MDVALLTALCLTGCFVLGHLCGSNSGYERGVKEALEGMDDQLVHH